VILPYSNVEHAIIIALVTFHEVSKSNFHILPHQGGLKEVLQLMQWIRCKATKDLEVKSDMESSMTARKGQPKQARTIPNGAIFYVDAKDWMTTNGEEDPEHVNKVRSF
jgi:hypothetical protein